MEDKKTQRIYSLKKRANMPDDEVKAKSALICKTLLNLPELNGSKSVLVYMATQNEVDLFELSAELKKREIAVAWPKTEPGKRMNAFVPDTLNDFEIGRYGISEPILNRSKRINPEEIDVIITPCVAFDKEKNRLGHGGGYYDRYFLLAKNAVRICVAFDEQRLTEIACEPHDIKMDLIVTEKEIIS